MPNHSSKYSEHQLIIPCQQQFRVLQPASPPVGYIGRSPLDSVTTDIGIGQLDNGGFWTQPKFVHPYNPTILLNVNQFLVPLRQKLRQNQLRHVQ
jgi:hypothetical protein